MPKLKRADDLTRKAIVLPSGVMPDAYTHAVERFTTHLESWMKTGVLVATMPHYGDKDPTGIGVGTIQAVARRCASELRRPFVYANLYASQVAGQGGRTTAHLIMPRNARLEVLWAPLLVVAQENKALDADVREASFAHQRDNKLLRIFVFNNMDQFDNWMKYATTNPKCQWALGVRADYPRE